MDNRNQNNLTPTPANKDKRTPSNVTVNFLSRSRKNSRQSRELNRLVDCWNKLAENGTKTNLRHRTRQVENFKFQRNDSPNSKEKNADSNIKVTISTSNNISRQRESSTIIANENVSKLKEIDSKNTCKQVSDNKVKATLSPENGAETIKIKATIGKSSSSLKMKISKSKISNNSNIKSTEPLASEKRKSYKRGLYTAELLTELRAIDSLRGKRARTLTKSVSFMPHNAEDTPSAENIFRVENRINSARKKQKIEKKFDIIPSKNARESVLKKRRQLEKESEPIPPKIARNSSSHRYIENETSSVPLKVKQNPTKKSKQFQTENYSIPLKCPRNSLECFEKEANSNTRNNSLRKCRQSVKESDYIPLKIPRTSSEFNHFEKETNSSENERNSLKKCRNKTRISRQLEKESDSIPSKIPRNSSEYDHFEKEIDSISSKIAQNLVKKRKKSIKESDSVSFKNERKEPFPPSDSERFSGVHSISTPRSDFMNYSSFNNNNMAMGMSDEDYKKVDKDKGFIIRGGDTVNNMNGVFELSDRHEGYKIKKHYSHYQLSKSDELVAEKKVDLGRAWNHDLIGPATQNIFFHGMSDEEQNRGQPYHTPDINQSNTDGSKMAECTNTVFESESLSNEVTLFTSMNEEEQTGYLKFKLRQCRSLLTDDDYFTLLQDFKHILECTRYRNCSGRREVSIQKSARRMLFDQIVYRLQPEALIAKARKEFVQTNENRNDDIRKKYANTIRIHRDMYDGKSLVNYIHPRISRKDNDDLTDLKKRSEILMSDNLSDVMDVIDTIDANVDKVDPLSPKLVQLQECFENEAERFNAFTSHRTNGIERFNAMTSHRTNGTERFNAMTSHPISGTERFNALNFHPTSGTERFNALNFHPTNGTERFNPLTYNPFNGTKRFNALTSHPINCAERFNALTSHPTNGTLNSRSSAPNFSELAKENNLTTSQEETVDVISRLSVISTNSSAHLEFVLTRDDNNFDKFDNNFDMAESVLEDLVLTARSDSHNLCRSPSCMLTSVLAIEMAGLEGESLSRWMEESGLQEMIYYDRSMN